MSASLARWKDLCLDAVDPHRLGEFWAPVLGLHRDPAIAQAVTLAGSAPAQRVWVNLVDRPRTVKNRLHLDVYAASVDDLVAFGATVLAPAEETGLGWTVMADPEGGEFCAFLRDPAELPAYRLHGIGIDCVDAAAQAAWWGRVFGVAPTNEEGQDWHTLERATPDPVLTLDFAPVPEPRVGPNRVHWDVTGDVDVLLDAGATRLWDMPDWVVLADPEGNEFCVFADRPE
jgi:catechol 2,3-dioxygenase-like lactoylglutathione lyase family enzyme